MRNSARLINRFAALLVLVVMVGCGGAGIETGSSAADGPPAVVILAVDGLRADVLGSYGGSGATPNLDALAGQAIRFDWAFAQAPEFTTSLATMLSGLYPTTNGKIGPAAWMADEAMTLAEVLGEAGWATAAFLEGAADGSDFGLAQGFATFELGPQPGAAAVQWMRAHSDTPALVVVGGWSAAAMDAAVAAVEGAPEGFAERVNQVVASRGSDIPELFDEADLEHIRALRAARVTAVDQRIGAFMTEFRALGWADRTTLVVIGSNGTALQEHGDLFGESLYAPVVRVPLLLRMPGASAAVVDKVVELVDLMPTVLEIAGVPSPEGLQGASLLSIVEDRGTPPYIAFGESTTGEGQYYAVLAGFHVVQRGEVYELYNLVDDPLEQNDLAGTDDKRLKVLRQHLEAWRKLVAATSLDPELRAGTLDEDTVEQLKSLGYIQ